MAQIFGESASAGDERVGLYQPVVATDEVLLRQQLNEYLLAHERDYTDASIQWEKGQWGVAEEVDGVLLKSGEMERITSALYEYPPVNSEPVSFTANYESVPPKLFSNDLEDFLANIQKFVEKPITINIDREKSELSLLENKDWLIVDSVKKTFQLNHEFAGQWAQEFTNKMNLTPETVIMTGVENVVSEYDEKIFKRAIYQGSFRHGRTLNRDKLLSDLIAVLVDPNLERAIDVEFTILPPLITSHVPGYDFPQRLSTGVSSYRYGNYPARVTNIKLSLQSFQGVIVEPGEEMSFNRVTGWIIPEKGYTKTQIIEEGVVKEGVGGGVCQTSSTVYRAVLNAGFPVTERRNHSLDVIYYHEFGYGLDATVYTDSRADLRFVNDFPTPILINVYTDDVMNHAHVEFYGVTDGRRVELTPIPTGNLLLKQWDWRIIWPEKEELRTVYSRYQLPKEEKVEVNPLEG